MILALSVIRHSDEPDMEPRTVVLGALQCTIGRGQECDIVLEDPTRHISRKHVTIVRRGESYVLMVESRINPVFLNGQAVVAGQDRQLSAGDNLVIGSYEFELVDAPESERRLPQAANPFAPASGLGGDLDDLFRDAPAKTSARDSRLEDLIGPPGQSGRAHDPLLDAFGKADSGRSSSFTSDKSDPDPLAGIFGHDPLVSPASVGAPGYDPMHPGMSEASIDALLGSPTNTNSDPLGLAQNLHRPPMADQFGGGRGGSLELEHVHEVNLPFPSGIASAVQREAAPVVPSQRLEERLLAERGIWKRPLGTGDPLLAAESDSASPLHVFDRGLQATPPLTASVPPLGAAYEDPLSALFADPPLPPRSHPPVVPGDAPAESNACSELASPECPMPSRDVVSAREHDLAVVRGQGKGKGKGKGISEDLFHQRTAIIPPEAGEAPGPARSNVAPAAGPRVDSAAEALRSFLAGSGMEAIEIPSGEESALLHECGATVRAAIEGLMGLLLARAKVKEELHAHDRTMVAMRENNALKLMGSPDEALRFVFDPKARTEAFLPLHEAVADACGDLQSHEFALVAGMRAALVDAVKRFQPHVIEKRLEKEGGRSLLSNRKAMLWDCFVAYYEQTERDAEDHFERVFGAAFLRAYHEQLKRLGR